MLIVSLPFPPLPVVCIKSCDSNYSHASGHDLLSVAIASMIVGKDNKAGFDSMQVLERKQSIVIELNDRIAAVWGTHEKDNENSALEECYEIFCTQFRLYMGCYPGSCDIRIMDMDSVCASDIIVKQAIGHLNAMASTFTDEAGSVDKFQIPLNSTNCYKTLIRLYVLGIYSLSRETPVVAQNHRIEPHDADTQCP